MPDAPEHQDVQALQEEVARLRWLVEANPQVPWEADAEGNVTDFSQRWLDLTGLSREEALGGGWVRAPHPDDLPAMVEAWTRSIRTGEPYDVEHRIRLANGTYRWMRSRATARRAPNGEILAWYAATEDVHERKVAEVALRQSEARYRATFENAALGIAHVGLDGRWLRFNDALAEITGYAREELLGMTFGDLTHPDDLDEDWAQARRMLAGEIERYAMEKRYVRKDGRTVWAKLTASLLRSEAGEPLHFISIVEDVTAKKEAERALRESEAALRTFYDCSPLLMGVVEVPPDDSDIVHLYDSPSTERLFGRPRGSTEGQSALAMGAPPEVVAEWIGRYRQSEREGGTVSFQYTHPSPKGPVRLSTAVCPVGTSAEGRSRFAYVTEDVTERTQAEQDLKRIQESLSLAMRGGRMGWWRRDLVTDEVDWSPELEEIFGLEAGTFAGTRKSFLDYVHPDDRTAFAGAIRTALETREEYVVEFRFVRADGVEGWMEGRGRALYDDEGKATASYGIGIDISLRKAAEEALRRRDRRRRFLLELGDAVRSLSSPRDIVRVASRMTGEELDVARCGYALVYADEDRFVVENDHVRGVPSLAGSYALSGLSAEQLDRYRKGKPIVVRDTATDPVAAPHFASLYAPLSIHSSLSIPLLKDGRWVATFAVQHDAPRDWSEDESRLMQDVAERVWEAVERARAEREVQERESRYRALAEGVPVMVWTAGPDGAVDFVSQRWKDYFALDLDAAQSGAWTACVHPEDNPGVQAEWRRSVASQAPFIVEYRLRRADGAYRWHLCVAHPRVVSGGIAGWIGGIVDIHEQKETQRTLALANEVTARLAEDLDVERIVQTLTDASTEAVGARSGAFFYNVLNEPGEAFPLDAPSGAAIEAFSSLGLPQTTNGWEIVRSDDLRQDPRYPAFEPRPGMPKGDLPVVSYLAVPVVSRSGEVVGGLLFGHPEPGRFTAAHEALVASFAAQAAVAMDNARLYESVTAMKSELEQKVRERTLDLQASNDALTAFTYHVSHDLRGPLRAIVSTSRIVQEDYAENLPAEAVALLNRQADAAGKLGRLIDDLLRLSRLSHAELHKIPLDLSLLGREVAAEALDAHPGSLVRVEIDAGLAGEADPQLIRLALGNLLENAVKYSPQGGSVRFGRRADGAFFVSDQGIGIDPRYFGKIFEPFQRLHRDEEFAGTGIGLSNVRQVVERHGGRVWVESSPGAGSTFAFTLESSASR